ncbi:MAG: PilZ domain-containing protein, partial [Hyphomicrobiaceae bacterium]
AAQSQDAKPEHDSLLSLRMATDKPFIIHRKANIVATAVNQVPDRVWRKRREKRVAARLPAVLSKEGSSKTRSCIILDTSSGGARIQVEPDKLNHAIGQLFVGDTITLMFEMGQKQTSVTCLVVWVDGIYCGVKYSGQFSTKNVRSNKAGTNNSSQNTRRADNSKSTNRTLGRFFKSEDEVAQPSNSRP